MNIFLYKFAKYPLSEAMNRREIASGRGRRAGRGSDATDRAAVATARSAATAATGPATTTVRADDIASNNLYIVHCVNQL